MEEQPESFEATASVTALEFGFEQAEAAFEFPLLAGAFAGLQEVRARGGRFFGAELIVGARRGRHGELIGSGPQTFAGKENVFDAGANHVLEFGVGEAVRLDSAEVFAGHIAARNAFIVSGKRNRDAEFAIDREWMILAADAEDSVITGEIDFNHDVFASHFVEQPVRVVFPQGIDAMTNAFRASFHGQANVAAQTFIGD